VFNERGKTVDKGIAQAASVGLEAQKYQTLLELSKAIALHRNVPDLFHDIACRLKNLFDFNYLAVVLHDGLHNTMNCNPGDVNPGRKRPPSPNRRFSRGMGMAESTVSGHS
jgi:hypothetical protein